jgi:hypothetical protein
VEEIMSKTNSASNLEYSTFEDRDTLDDAALNAVTGGTSNAAPKLYEAACKGTHIPVVAIE